MVNLKTLRGRAGVMKRRALSAAAVQVPKLTGGAAYFAATGAFRAEQNAVAAGMRHHYNAENTYRSQMFMRRSVHRIEKGLTSRPLRTSFAGDYIEKTVNTVTRLMRDPDHGDPDELRWAKDVLNSYFRATAGSIDSRVQRARASWKETGRQLPQAPEKSTGATAESLEPFEQTQLVDGPSRYSSFAAIAEHRRSVRFFKDAPVPRDVVEEAVRVGLTAPSACNRQSFRLHIVDNPVLRAKVAAIPMGTAGFAEQIPATAVLIGQHRGYEHERDRHAIYVDGGLFATGFILALEGLGLNTCCINWPDMYEKDRQMRRAIDIADDERVIMLIAIGYGRSSQLVPRSHKRNAKAVVSWE